MTVGEDRPVTDNATGVTEYPATAAWNRRSPVPEGDGLQVKALEWVKHPTADLWRADCILGRYQAYAVISQTSWAFDAFDGITKASGDAADADEAKVAAQAHYTARILGEIISPAPVKAEAEVWKSLSPFSGKPDGLMALHSDEDEAKLYVSEHGGRVIPLYATPSSGGRREALLEWFGSNIRLELSWGPISYDEGEECAWCVHECTGNRSDREWTLLSHGSTPLEAIYWEAFEGDSSGMVDDAERAKRNMRLWHAIEATLELSAAPQPSAPEGWSMVPEDLLTHIGDWETACKIALDHSEPPTVDSDDHSYWEHQLKALSHIRAALASPPTGRDATEDVRAERERQRSVEGWTPEHDDTHTHGELAQAAAAYAFYCTDAENGQPTAVELWPTTWSEDWWKASEDTRRNLIKAGALILAEIERLDRLAAPKPETAQKGGKS